MGASFDDPAENAEFAAAQGFQYELWSDPDRTLAMHFGAATSPTQPLASRRTVVLDEQGRLCLRYDTVGVTSHPSEVLEDVTKLLAATGSTPP